MCGFYEVLRWCREAVTSGSSGRFRWTAFRTQHSNNSDQKGARNTKSFRLTGASLLQELWHVYCSYHNSENGHGRAS